jgi:MinD-like ATPase involved in chromosome partitioning or flagellar assembly
VGSIVTFYSYKGGVGRSMALANIALVLARGGKRVLVVDWDLEAPGLDKYFQDFPMVPDGAGLLPMLTEGTGGHRSSYQDYTWKIDIGGGESITFLPSGRERDPLSYASQLERFDWIRFFKQGGGDYLEGLRRTWKKDFDIVLIDSRTGLSDAGGVCTIQLPDIVIVMFTANDQSMLGARDVMRYVRRARQSLAYSRMQLTVFPLPARFSSLTEVKESQRWIDRFSDEFGEFYHDWLPSWAEPREVVQKVKVPQVDFYSFGEKLPVVEEGVSDPGGMGYVYDLVARILGDDFQAAHQILGLRDRVNEKSRQSQRSESGKDYKWDLYVSYRGLSFVNAMVEKLLERLRQYLTADIRIFWHRQEVVLEDTWPELKDALLHSRLLLAILTPEYFEHRQNVAEWRTFNERERLTDTGEPLILPIIFRGATDDLPPDARMREFVDIRYLVSPRQLDTIRSRRTIESLAESVARTLSRVPPFRPDFPLVDPADI